MWAEVTADVMMKSTLFILDAEDQLSSMKLADNNNLKTHLSELKQHFQLMMQCHKNILKMGSVISDTWFNMMIMLSLLESYHPTLQMITVSEQASALMTGSAPKKMKPSDLITFLIEEAHHRVINDERSKNLEQALAAHSKKKGKGKLNWAKTDDKALNTDSNVTCHNCGKSGHKKADCWSKGGGKEGQGPRSRKGKKADAAVVAAVDDDDKELFAFTCTSNFTNVAEAPRAKIQAGNVYWQWSKLGILTWPFEVCQLQTDWLKYHYGWQKSVEGSWYGRSWNRPTQWIKINQNVVHTPEMAFTLISMSRLDKAGFQVTFKKGMCMIMNLKAQVIMTISHSDGLYWIAASKPAKEGDYAATVSGKMSISEAHRELGHISYGAVQMPFQRGISQALS